MASAEGMAQAIDQFAAQLSGVDVDLIAGIESTKITYALGFGFLFWCLFMGAVITKQYSSSTDLEEIQEEIIIDETIEEQIPEVPNQ